MAAADEELSALQRKKNLSNIVERLQLEKRDNGIFCSYCDSSVPAIKCCLHCEAFVCSKHLRMHSKSEKHILVDPTIQLGERKCSVHDEVFKYYCYEDYTCICVSCWVSEEHRGHWVELLNEASAKKKKNLKSLLGKMSSEREDTEREVQRLQEQRREVREKAAGETKQVTAMFRGIRDQLEALEKKVLSEISRQKEELSLKLLDLIQQMEIKKAELSKKIHHIAEVCNMTDPLSVLQEWESDGADFCGDEWEDNESDDIVVPAVKHLDVNVTLFTGLVEIVTSVQGCWFPGQEATDMLLDINTASSQLSLSDDWRSLSHSCTDQCYPQSPEEFQYPQALSTNTFTPGRHYWDVEGSESGSWKVGVAYFSVEREGVLSWIGENNKSWCLYKWDNKYSVMYDRKETKLPHVPSCRKIRITLDHEARRLSFYELSEPIRPLHSFTADFTEPLHAAFWVGWDAWVRIIS
ncbi:E3 ubiquitin-protein ligase TRIM7 [Xenopus laevis]|uniref:E3 ubiquitin-protein ligase TRIM7 n=2 Tax=Xenopus laevis TaxID=8355 RepID=A0A1L8GDF9_XENLA|nr:E3 ubiquitin-protein ligase TRIM7 [Xenopus laevis]OCT81746.1 hypothetical protein XELAEV_18024254mg [Xenopus laevis]